MGDKFPFYSNSQHPMALPIRNTLHSAEHRRDWYRAPIPVSSSTQNPVSNPEDRVIPRTLRVPGLRLHIGFEPIVPYPPACLGPYSLSRISRQTRHFSSPAGGTTVSLPINSSVEVSSRDIELAGFITEKCDYCDEDLESHDCERRGALRCSRYRILCTASSEYVVPCV